MSRPRRRLSAEPETLYLGGVGAVYVEKLEFVLPETWAGMAVTLHIEQEGGTMPQPMLLDGNNNAPVDGRFTTARQGLWMLMATDGEGRREMTMPGKYVCYQTLENGEGTGADGPAMPLRYQYLQLVLEQEARAALEAQRAARYRQWVADRCAAKEHALLLEALSGMRYSDASAWDMIAQLKQRWNSPPPEQAEPVAVESIRLDSKELSIKVGESCPLKATVLPGSAPQTVEWMAEPEGIVQLRENTLTAVKGGTALLTAIAGGKLAQRRVRSVAVSLEKLALDKPSVKLKQGESVTLTATLTPTQSTVTAVSWTTNNAALAVMMDAELKYYRKDYGGALESLNIIAKRAYGKDDYYTDASQEAVLEALVDEYFLEFPAEGVIWWALIRLDKIWDYNDYLAANRNNTNILLWPISKSARDKNSNLTQTEGWY